MMKPGSLEFHGKKRWMALTVALIVISFVIASGSSVVVSAQTPELVLWARGDYGWDLDGIINDFARDYGVNVRVEVMPLEELRQRFVEEAAGNNAPDIITDSDELVRGYLEQNLLAPIDFGGRVTDYIPFAIQVFTHDDRLYAVPYAFENLAFVRNTEIVPTAPLTWTEVHDMAREAVDSGAAEFGFVVINDNVFYHFFPVIDAFGGYLFRVTLDGNFDEHDIGMNNDGAIAAAEWLQNMVQEGLTPAAMNWDEAHAAFEQGRVAMLITGPWGTWRFVDAGVPFELSAFPSMVRVGRPYVHVQGFLINAHSDQQELAQEFLIRYVATEESMRSIAEHARRLSAHQVVFETMGDPALRGFDRAAQHGQRYPDTPHLMRAREIMSEALREIMGGNRPPQAVLFDAVTVLREEIGE